MQQLLVELKTGIDFSAVLKNTFNIWPLGGTMEPHYCATVLRCPLFLRILLGKRENSY